MTPKDLVRANVLNIRPYSPGKPIQEVQRELGLDDVIKLASNENPLGPSPKAVEAIRRALPELNLYPDAGSVDLKANLAKRHGLPANQIAVGCGSDELLTLVGMSMLEPGDEVVMADPSFISYPLVALRCAATPVMVPLTPDERHDLPAMAAACGPKTKLVYVANPNNPTGTIVTAAEVQAFLRALPEHVLPVFDEAYFEYVAHPSYPDTLPLVQAGRDIASMRTFSKIHGLAGLRVGYMMGPAWLVDAVDRVREPFDVSSLAQVAAIAAMDDDEHVSSSREANRHGLDFLHEEFGAMGLRHAESHANFAWVDSGRPAAEVFDGLLRRGVIVRPGHVFGRPTHLRVTTGTEEQMVKFRSAFREVLAK
jgi:histidinol-phosphate aminotransferase